jgi:3D-(3,5/4)-trihydroxycyclohexane-1,2-dione acylhydrolase (decyclizing)
VDFAAHARSLGAQAEKVEMKNLEAALQRALRSRKTAVVVVDTEPRRSTAEGGTWWDVAVTEAPRSAAQKKARAAYERARKKQALGA